MCDYCGGGVGVVGYVYIVEVVGVLLNCYGYGCIYIVGVVLDCIECLCVYGYIVD